MFEKKIVNLGNGIWSCTCHEHSYEGEMQNGKYHGKGKMIDNFYDEEYIGDFVDGFKNGIGREKYSYEDENGEKVNREYNGEFLNGYFHGKGTIKYNNGEYYKGEFKNGKYNGQGELRLDNGQILKGKFDNGLYCGFGEIYSPLTSFPEISSDEYVKEEDKKLPFDGYTINEESYGFWGSKNYFGAKQGYGVLKLNDGTYFEGGFKNDKYHGFGTLTLKTEKYTGQFKDGKYDGIGELNDSIAKIYTIVGHYIKSYKGEFKNGYFHGNGILEGLGYGTRFWKNYTKLICIGTFVKSYFHGKGCIYAQHGITYKGDVSENTLHGFGELFYPNGDSYIGNFDGGEFSGNGVLSFIDGRKYVGAFSRHKFDGIGMFYCTPGDMYIGKFKNGLFHGNGILTLKDGNCFIGKFDNNSFLAKSAVKQNLIDISNFLEEKKEKYYLFIDTETTGLPDDYNAPLTDFTNWPRIVQISYVLCDEKEELIAEADFIIQPDGFNIPIDSTKIHGISQQEAIKNGFNLISVLQHLAALISRVDFVIGHNIAFDEKIIGSEFLRNDFKNPIEAKKKFCTMIFGTEYINSINKQTTKWPRLSELYEKLFHNQFDYAHNALQDSKATAKCFWELKRRGVIKIPLSLFGL